jgi:hypothetical protein
METLGTAFRSLRSIFPPTMHVPRSRPGSTEPEVRPTPGGASRAPPSSSWLAGGWWWWWLWWLWTAQQREAQPGQGRGKDAASLARRGSTVGNRRPRGARASAGEGDFAVGWSGPVGALSFGAARRQASSARWPAAAASRWDRIGEGREERGWEREKGRDSN